MANPRQRRKSRSGTHRPVQHSRRAKTLLKKQPPIRGPRVLQEAWDGRKTVRQNYEALGLVASLIVRVGAGTEQGVRGRADMEEACEGSKGANGIAKGYGRIVRDGEGKVVEVQLGPEDGLDAGEEEGLAGLERRRGGATRVVQALEQLSAVRGVGVGRFASRGEAGALSELVRVHGLDVEAMARDRRLNAGQRTAGALRRGLRRAGLAG